MISFAKKLGSCLDKNGKDNVPGPGNYDPYLGGNKGCKIGEKFNEKPRAKENVGPGSYEIAGDIS